MVRCFLKTPRTILASLRRPTRHSVTGHFYCKLSLQHQSGNLQTLPSDSPLWTFRQFFQYYVSEPVQLALISPPNLSVKQLQQSTKQTSRKTTETSYLLSLASSLQCQRLLHPTSHTKMYPRQQHNSIGLFESPLTLINWIHLAANRNLQGS